MPAKTDSGGQPRAMVVAADDALRLSVVFLLQICGLDAVGAVDLDDLLASCDLDEEFIFVDCWVGGHSGFPEIEQLRARGWEGTVVFMAEEELPPDWVPPEGPSHVLVKPFSSDDVLAIFGNQSDLTRAAKTRV